MSEFETYAQERARIAIEAAKVPAELIEAVKSHALDNYGHRRIRWDYVIETMEDADIAAHIVGARTVAGAIRAMAKVCRLFGEQELNCADWG